MSRTPDQDQCFERERALSNPQISSVLHREAGEVCAFIDMLLTTLKPPELILDKGGIERLYEDRTTRRSTPVVLGGCGNAGGNLGSLRMNVNGGREVMICDSGGARSRRTSSRLVLLGLLLCLTATGCGDSESNRDATEPISPPKAEGHTIPRALIELPREPEDAKGRFREFKNFRGVERQSDLTPEQIAELERLSAIGYVSGSVPSAGFQNLTVFDEKRAESGLNFYLSGHGAEAALVDMRGNVLHRWSVDFADVWPDLAEMSHLKWTYFIRRAHLFENGDILAVWDSVGIARIDKDSKVVWAQPNMAHHDLQVMPNGDIYVITSTVEMNPRVNAEQPIRDDQVTLLDSEGNVKRSVSILEAFEKSETYRGLWEARTAPAGELFHTNTLHVLDGRIEDDIPAFKKGNILVSSLVTDIIAVIDLERGEVVWAWGEGFHAQHDPQILPSGNLLLFDNHDGYEKSSIEEYNPRTMELVWSYRGSDSEPFYSRTCGTAQRLRGGNTLVTDSDNGRAFEITREGEIVWEFYNPHFAGENNEFIAVLLELQRLPADFPISWAQVDAR